MVTDTSALKALAGTNCVGQSVSVHEGGSFSPLASPVSTSHPAQANLIPENTFTADGGDPSGVGPAWYPDIQPFNISQAIKATPGYGEQYANCGEVRYVVTCPDEPTHHKKIVAYRCHRPACPTCWPSWAARAATKAAETVEGYQSVTRTHRFARHIDISPHPKDVPFTEPTPEALTWLYDQGVQKARILGLQAAIPIPHPYRIRPEKEAEVAAAAKAAGSPNRYMWALAQPNWSDLVYFSPHIHIIGYGRLMDSIQFQHKTGWQYHNHDEKTEGRKGDALRGTLYYLLTHAWVNGNHKIVRYWFGMSTHRLKRVDEGYEKIAVACPVCAAACVSTPPDIVWQDGSVHPIYQDLHNAPHTVRKLLHWHYEARTPKPRTKPTQAPLQQGAAIS